MSYTLSVGNVETSDPLYWTPDIVPGLPSWSSPSITASSSLGCSLIKGVICLLVTHRLEVFLFVVAGHTSTFEYPSGLQDCHLARGVLGVSHGVSYLPYEVPMLFDSRSREVTPFGFPSADSPVCAVHLSRPLTSKPVRPLSPVASLRAVRVAVSSILPCI